MRILFSKPRLYGLSQGDRISYIRQLRMMTQDEVSDKLGITGDCKRRTMTRYERGNRKPGDKRIKELSEVLQVNINLIKQYDFENIIDLIYLFLWLEELYPKIEIYIPDSLVYMDKNKETLNVFLNEWEKMRTLKNNKTISFYEYIDWKFNYEIEWRDRLNEYRKDQLTRYRWLPKSPL